MAEYDYLDGLDYAGWAWECLRRSEDYRADYNYLQSLDASETEHEHLANKWHVMRMLDPASREVPEFSYPPYEPSHLDDFWQRNSPAWSKFMSENKRPRFSTDAWKHSIICKDLQNARYSLNKIAERLYPGHKSLSHDTRHHPARDRVRDDLARLKKLQSDYLKIAYYSALQL